MAAHCDCVAWLQRPEQLWPDEIVVYSKPRPAGGERAAGGGGGEALQRAQPRHRFQVQARGLWALRGWLQWDAHSPARTHQ